ncbi:MAG: response regulator [Magnetococcales bacterium]|nr:response regulator [Magnetococcales bacterium]
MKILIVEDQLSIQEKLRFVLEGHGSIDTALNGREAVEAFCRALANRSPYDLVLMDIQMPEMDGQTALKEMRKAEVTMSKANLLSWDKKLAFIVMVTSLEDPGNCMEAYFKGRCNGYITKPVDSRELLDKLRDNGLIP